MESNPHLLHLAGCWSSKHSTIHSDLELDYSPTAERQLVRLVRALQLPHFQRKTVVVSGCVKMAAPSRFLLLLMHRHLLQPSEAGSVLPNQATIGPSEVSMGCSGCGSSRCLDRSSGGLS